MDRLTPETLMGLARLFPSRRVMPKTTMGLDAHAAQWEKDLARIEALEKEKNAILSLACELAGGMESLNQYKKTQLHGETWGDEDGMDFLLRAALAAGHEKAQPG